VAPAATATEIWELAGVPVTHLPQGTVMSIDDCVDAAMAGLDQGELITTPSIEDVSLLGAYDTARLALFGGGRSDRPASRYAVGS